MNKKNNKRFQENERKIQEVFIKLLDTHDINHITVREICEKAKINRSTFYAHYKDVYDLLDKLEKSMNQKLISQYDSTELDEILFKKEKFFIPFLEFISKNRTFYKTCLKKRNNFPIEEGFEPLWNRVVKPNCLKIGIISEDEMMYYFVYFQAGITMILRRWVANGCKESPQQISNYILNCLSKITT
ncbi:TetR family transcriptional regulator [Clostridium perfringens]|nr:TetR family transcriptional regulator [Clostridium perfringens]